MADKIVDACSLINLYASGKFESIIAGCGGEFYVSEQVQSECKMIRQPDPKDGALLIPLTIDLSEAITNGNIKKCCLEGDAEIQMYVEFAAQLDDGEACCLAIAKSRGWIVATDDQKAMRLASEEAISVITTPELILRWTETANPTDAEVAEVLQGIERFARFRPRQANSLHDWWISRSDPN